MSSTNVCSLGRMVQSAEDRIKLCYSNSRCSFGAVSICMSGAYPSPIASPQYQYNRVGSWPSQVVCIGSASGAFSISGLSTLAADSLTSAAVSALRISSPEGNLVIGISSVCGWVSARANGAVFSGADVAKPPETAPPVVLSVAVSAGAGTAVSVGAGAAVSVGAGAAFSGGGATSELAAGMASLFVADVISVSAAGAASVVFTGAGASVEAGASSILVSPPPTAPVLASLAVGSLLWMYAMTASTVFCGPACSQTLTVPCLSMMTTPRVVLFGAFFMPMAPVSEAEGSQISGKGRDCLVAKVVFDLGESVLRP